MKSKGLVIAGIVLIIISLVFFAPPVERHFLTSDIKAPGGFEISGIPPEEAVHLFVFVVIFFTGVGLLVKGFI